MVQEINTQYIGKIDNSGAPVTCGTCHRGHLDPQPSSLRQTMITTMALRRRLARTQAQAGRARPHRRARSHDA